MALQKLINRLPWRVFDEYLHHKLFEFWSEPVRKSVIISHEALKRLF